MDPRITKLAEIMVNYSIKVNKGDIIEVAFGDHALELALEIQRLILEKEALPKLNPILPGMRYNFLKHASEETLAQVPKYYAAQVDEIAGYISIPSPHNTKELQNIDPEKIAIRSKAFHDLHEKTITQNNWVLTQYPSNALAQDAELSLKEFTDFYFDAVLVDYEEMSKKQDKLKELFDKGKVARVKTPDSELTVNIEGREGIKCCGKRNIPDGEVFCGPVETDVNGHIKFSFPAIYQGREVDGVELEFTKGVVTKATAKKNEEFLLKTLETDEGAKRLGEFAIAMNYNIKNHIKQILFDEKIGGTIHMALGAAYKKGGGKNESAIHWDMIKDLRKEAGGGEVWIDDTLVLKDGKLLV